MKRYTKTCALLFFFIFSGAATASEEMDVLELRKLGNAHLANLEWQAASDIFGQLVNLNPYSGDDFLRLGYARLQEDKCHEALSALDKAIQLSAFRGEAAYQASRCALRLGQKDLFDTLFRTAIRHGKRDFSRLEDEPGVEIILNSKEYRQLLGLPSGQTLSKTQQWVYDIETLVAFLESQHPNPWHQIPREIWLERVETLKANIEGLTSLQIVGEMMKLLALIGDGHTTFYPPMEGDLAFHLLPFHPYRFEEGVFVIAADPQYAQLVGNELLEINGHAFEDIVDRSHQYLSGDNPATRLWLEEAFMQFPEAYQLLGLPLGEDGKSLNLKARGPEDIIEEIVVPFGAFDRNPLSRVPPDNWTQPLKGEAKPVWQKNLNRDFWFETLEEGRVVYAQINQTTNGEDETFEERSENLLAFIQEKNPDAVVLDLRMNNGGNATLTNKLVVGLAANKEINQRGRLFVITGRRTFSAAGLFVAYLDRYTEALFVGTPMAAKPNGYGDDNLFTLPYSGLQGSISKTLNMGTGFSSDDRPWIAPDFYVPVRASDYFAGRDAALEKILGIIR